jgi:hypothetical protein
MCEDGTCIFTLIYTHTHGDGKNEKKMTVCILRSCLELGYYSVFLFVCDFFRANRLCTVSGVPCKFAPKLLFAKVFKATFNRALFNSFSRSVYAERVFILF